MRLREESALTNVVREGGVEPPRRKTLEPKSSASTSSATLAYVVVKAVKTTTTQQDGALCHVFFSNQRINFYTLDCLQAFGLVFADWEICYCLTAAAGYNIHN